MRKLLSAAIILSVIVSSCKKDDNGNSDDTFDRGLMLKNYANNLIIPAYNELHIEVIGLKKVIEVFTDTLGDWSLNNLQNQWLKTYKIWQQASVFNFGPAGEQGLNRTLAEEIATFPASNSKIEAAISNPNFTDFNRDARGFLAIEYLIFGLDNNNQSVLAAFENEDRKAYLKGAIANIESRISAVLGSWMGGYKELFIANNGTDVGSSTSQLYNEFVKAFETNKNFKIELPLGKRPGQTQAEPQLVEGYYSGKSLDFLSYHLNAIENIYFGKGKTGGDFKGFKDYLETVTGGKALVESTVEQWSKVFTTFKAIPTDIPLSQLIIDNPQPIEDLRVELQKHTRFFKSDMSSLLGIAITFSSGDGD